MGDFHLEFGGFAKFDTVEAARAAAYAIERILGEKAILDNTGFIVRDMKEQKNLSLYQLSYNEILCTYGVQTTNAHVNKLFKHINTHLSETVDKETLHNKIVSLQDRRYSVNLEAYIAYGRELITEEALLQQFLNTVPTEA